MGRPRMNGRFPSPSTQAALSGDARDIVAAKRDGATLGADELRRFVLGCVSGDVSDELAAAFLMAAFIRGLDPEETLALTRAMVDSGRTIRLEGVSRPTVDKHSTGGVADGVTLVFAPLAAALGMAVAKLSGRGLGHTGGTLDKLEAVPGLRTDLDPAGFVRQVEEIGCVVAAQTPDLVPADGKLYALRDATATVPSIPLIASSVMSKKLAVETDLVLLDVKSGSGAFMKTVGSARSLAAVCADLAQRWGRACRVAVTDMSQPLGAAIGNALDIVETIALLRGEDRGRLREAAVLFAAEAQDRLLGISEGEARARAERAIDDGDALEVLRRMIEAQGGDARVVDDPVGVLPAAPVVLPLVAPTAGYLAGVDAEQLGRASAELGAGRKRKGDPVDPAVGIVFRPKVGDRVELGQELGVVHGRNEDAASGAVRRVLGALVWSDEPVEPLPLVHGWFG
ncbi:MAG TPA: thymidine phosphorylase [Actinomycetota bacterium]|nr:thymidine phosphorylase [Actinomycetota bacterium]